MSPRGRNVASTAKFRIYIRDRTRKRPEKEIGVKGYRAVFNATTRRDVHSEAQSRETSGALSTAKMLTCRSLCSSTGDLYNYEVKCL